VDQPTGDDWVVLASEPLPVERVADWAVTPAAGAVVVFSGVVRATSDEREGITALTYEAYETVAVERMQAIVAAVRAQWPALARVAVLHRLGRVELGESSVVVAVSAPHRGDAFAGARACIDAVKGSVPIWKQDHWAGGRAWSTAETPIRPVG